MPEFTLPYGKTKLTFSLPDMWQTTLIAPKETPAASNPMELVKQALDQPVGKHNLGDFVGARSATIAISDKTRPVPHHHLLPPLLERLESMGLSPENITLLIATGTHPPMLPDEYPSIIPPDILARYPVKCHNANDKKNLVYLGQTERGTPVWINRHFVQADLRLVVGNMEPHQFMGFSGGVKSAAIGLAGKEVINHNHAMMTDAKSKLGHFNHNPARQDVEEIGRIIGIHFALNVILNENKQIVTAIAGEPRTVMEYGIPLVKKIYQFDVDAPFDVMIVSPGGHPKDINVYQSQKGLAHAARVTKKAGTIILAAACPEGSGSDKYEQWVSTKTSYQDVFDSFEREGFHVGAHKAFQIVRDASNVRLLLLSDVPDDFVRQLLLTPVNSLEEALAQTLDSLSSDARIGIMPLANSTIPNIKKL